MLAELEIAPVMLEAAVERMERVAGLALNRRFDAAMPYEDYEKVIDYMFAAGRERGIEIR
jgi:hypothetical protein